MATDARFLRQRIGSHRKNASYYFGRLGRPTLGLQPLDSYSRGAIMQIIEDRHGKHTTIITAQMPIAKWYEYIAEPTIADALMDRLLHHAHRIELKGESMRKKTLETPQNQTL